MQRVKMAAYRTKMCYTVSNISPFQFLFMPRRAYAEAAPQQNREQDKESEDLARQTLEDEGAITERKPHLAPMSPEMLFEKENELTISEEQLAQNQEELRTLLQAKGKGGDMERVATLTKESIALSAKIAKLTFELRQELHAQEYKGAEVKPKKAEADPLATKEQRLRVLAEDLGMTKNETRKNVINAEVDALIAEVAKAQGVTEKGIRARFEVDVEDAAAKARIKETARMDAASARKAAAEASAKDERLTAAADKMRNKRGEYAKQTQRLEEIAQRMSRSVNPEEKKALLSEADVLIPVLAKAQGVSEAALRADFAAAQEVGAESRAQDLAKRREAAQQFADEAEKGLRARQTKTREDIQMADQAAQEFRKIAEAQKFRPKLKEAALNLSNILDLDPDTAMMLWSDFEAATQKSAQLEGRSAKDIERDALRPLTRLWSEQIRTTNNKEIQKALADLMINPRAYVERIRTQEAIRKEKERVTNISEKFISKARQNLENRKNEREKYQALYEEMRHITEQKDTKAMATFYESLKRLAANEKNPEQAAAAKLLHELSTETATVARQKKEEGKKAVGDMFKALNNEARRDRATDKEAKRVLGEMNASAAAVRRLQQEEAERMTRELTREAVARKKEEAFDNAVLEGVDRLRPDAVRRARKESVPVVEGEEERAPLSEEITNAMTRAEADYFREQSKGPLTREEMRAAGLSGSASEAGWRSAEERKQAMEKREALMEQLNAITWKFWQAPGLRRQIAEIDRNEAAFQSNISSRMPKRSMRNPPQGAQTADRPISGVFPRL
jgi:hypothetical protein